MGRNLRLLTVQGWEKRTAPLEKQFGPRKGMEGK